MTEPRCSLVGLVVELLENLLADVFEFVDVSVVVVLVYELFVELSHVIVQTF